MTGKKLLLDLVPLLLRFRLEAKALVAVGRMLHQANPRGDQVDDRAETFLWTELSKSFGLFKNLVGFRRKAYRHFHQRFSRLSTIDIIDWP